MYAETMKILPTKERNTAIFADSGPSVARTTSSRRIAFISDGRGAGVPLGYAIDACSRQQAKIDLMIHGTTDRADIAALENQIRMAGLDHYYFQLGTKPVDDIIHYIRNQPALILLVAIPDDTAAKALIEEAIPKRAGLMPVPLVLVGDRPPACRTEKTAH
ncbi:MAG: hypothetical protein KDI83_10940 [Gammaproteobacteria bacterium]|nr:hypothetical protein [Gammaproteobacteria bacterium]